MSTSLAGITCPLTFWNDLKVQAYTSHPLLPTSARIHVTARSYSSFTLRRILEYIRWLCRSF
jgi:hypothetical protein